MRVSSAFCSSYFAFPSPSNMPSKSKRQRSHSSNLEKATESKRVCVGEPIASASASVGDEGLGDLLELSVDALNTDNETVDTSFDMDNSIKSDCTHITENFCEKWVTRLDWEDRALTRAILSLSDGRKETCSVPAP